MEGHPEPWVPPYCFKYLKAFYSLQGDRLNIAGHVGSIPMQSKISYLALVPREDPETFVSMITHADMAWLIATQRVRSYREDP